MSNDDDEGEIGQTHGVSYEYLISNRLALQKIVRAIPLKKREGRGGKSP